jgi:thioester reductase-like protein
VYEDDLLEEADGYFLGYSESKWVSERLVREASQRGLFTTIFRPGDIAGSSVTGIWKLDDFTSRLLVSYMQTKTIPETDIGVSLIPVDYISSAIVLISRNEKCAGKAFNLVNDDGVTSKQLMNMLNKNGYDIIAIPYEEWQKNLFDSTIENNALKALDYLFRESPADERSIVRRYGNLKPKTDISNTLDLLKDSHIRFPVIDEKTLALYVDNFKKAM